MYGCMETPARLSVCLLSPEQLSNSQHFICKWGGIACG